MNRKNISLFLALFFVFFLVGCNSDAIYQEAITALDTEDFASLNSSYEKLEKKDKELSAQVKQQFIEYIDEIYVASVNEEKFQDGYDTIKNIDSLVPQLEIITKNSLENIENIFKEKIDTIYTNHLETGEFNLAISEIESLKSMFPSLSSYIDSKKSNLTNDIEDKSETIYIDSIENGNYPSAITFYENVSAKVPSLEVFAKEKIDYFADILPEMALYNEGISLVENNDTKSAIKKFESIGENAQYYYNEAQGQLANVADGLFAQSKLEIIEAIQNSDFNNVNEIILLMGEYDKDKADDLKDNISLLLTQSIEDLKDKGLYTNAKSILTNAKNALPSLLGDITQLIDNINRLIPSMTNYKRGLTFLNSKDYNNAITYFGKVLGDATYYYNLSLSKLNTANNSLYYQYLSLAKTNFENKNIEKSVENINQALLYTNSTEAKNLKTQYENELSKYMEPYEIIEKLGKSIVSIYSYDDYGDLLGQGSGFVVSSNGKILTNYHVISDATSVSVRFEDGTKFTVQKIYEYSESTDYAIIQISKSGLTPLVLGDSEDIISGENVVTIGSPQGLNSTISEGIISYVNREVEGNSYIQTSAPISAGSSGGALLNMKGEVIGITTASFISGQNLNLAVPINLIKSHINSTSSQSFSQFANRLEYVDEDFTFDSVTVHYKGTMRNGKFHGEGKLTFGSGSYYEGDFVNDLFEGYGVYHSWMGMTYKGEFKADEYHGNGTQTFANGAVITGIWYEGEYTGQKGSPQGFDTKLTTSNGTLYLEWDDDAYDNYYIYYSYDLKTWQHAGNTKTKHYIPNPSSGELVSGFPDERFFYVCVEGVNSNGTTSGKSNYIFSWCNFTKINIYSSDGTNRYLGELTTNTNSPNSIFSSTNTYGSANYQYSIWNTNGIYGNYISSTSANSLAPLHPPKMVNQNGDLIGYLSWDIFFEAYNPEVIVMSLDELEGFAAALGL